LLAVVATAQEIQQAPVPLLAPSRRAAQKQAFLQAAAEKRVEQVLVEGARPVRLAAPEKQRSFWTALIEAFTVRPMRLASVVLMLTVLLLASTTVVTLAQESVPGDRVYPIKQWIRQQELYLSPPERRAIVRSEQEEELVQDLKKAAQSDLRDIIIEAEGQMLFHGYGAGYLNIGGLRVLPFYEPDPNTDEPRSMEIIGDLEPGEIVVLRYRLLPGQGGSEVPMVQGVNLEVIERQPPEPTPLPTATPTIPIGCRVASRPGWLPFNVQPGETLAALAYSTGSSLEELRLVNCLASDEVSEGAVLLLPTDRNQPESQISPTATVVSMPTDTVTPDLVVPAPTLPAPTATGIWTATLPVAPPATAAPGATATPSVVFTATIIMPPTGTTSATETPVAAPTVTTTVAVTPTNTVDPGEPASPVATWPTVTPTAEKTVTMTVEATLIPVASPEGPGASETLVMTATLPPADTATPVETGEAETATPSASPVVSATPTGETGPSATAEVTETPMATDTPTPGEPPGATTPEASATASDVTETPMATDTPTPGETPGIRTPEASATALATTAPTEENGPPTATSAPPPTVTSTPLPPPPTAPPPTATSTPLPPQPTAPLPTAISTPPSEGNDTTDGSAPVDSTDDLNEDA
jgi:hypothetical protein